MDRAPASGAGFRLFKSAHTRYSFEIIHSFSIHKELLKKKAGAIDNIQDGNPSTIKDLQDD